MGKRNHVGYRKRRRKHHRHSVADFSWEAEKNRQPDGFFRRIRDGLVFSVLAAITFVVGGILFYSRETSPETSGQKKIPLQRSEPEAPLPTDQETKSEAAISALLAFVNAPDHASRCDHLIGRSALRDKLEAYYERDGHSLPERIINPNVTSIGMDGREILIVSFIDETGKKISAPFEWDSGSYRLHWEAMTAHGDIPWQVFFDARPEGTFEMRANLYVHQKMRDVPADATRITALLTHPDLPEPQTVAIPVGSVVHRQLMNLPSGSDIPARIGIRWMDGEDHSLPLVTRWHHRDWISP